MDQLWAVGLRQEIDCLCSALRSWPTWRLGAGRKDFYVAIHRKRHYKAYNKVAFIKLPLSSSYSHSRSSFSHINVRTRSDISKQIAANLCRLPIRIDLGYIYDLNKSSNDIGKCVCMSPRCLACWAKRSTQKRYLLKDEQRLPNSYCTFL